MTKTTIPLMAALLIDALDDFQRSIEGLTAVEAETRLPHFSPISWTIAHVAQHLDSWVVGTMAGKQRNPYLSVEQFGQGGSGQAAKWEVVTGALTDTLAVSREYLKSVDENELTRETTYNGGVPATKGKNISGNYRLARITAHIYYHIGEITTIRSSMRHKVDGYPGGWTASVSVVKR